MLEELGAETHVCFRVDATRVSVDTGATTPRTRRRSSADHATLFTARVDARTHAAQGATVSLAVDPARFHFFDAVTGDEPRDRRRACGGSSPNSGLDHEQGNATMARSPVERKAMSGTSQPTTKQSEVRSRVLDLIEQLGVGDAIPSERQLTSELGVSRLTVRAALDELVREGMLVRRHGSGTFVSEPKIAQELTMTSFTEDMRRRGMMPGQPHARPPRDARRARTWGGCCTSRRPSRS